MSFSFFFSSRRRHTRSLCDWSSDVCSSDLLHRFVVKNLHCFSAGSTLPVIKNVRPSEYKSLRVDLSDLGDACSTLVFSKKRSEERRVGKECRSRRSPYT